MLDYHNIDCQRHSCKVKKSMGKFGTACRYCGDVFGKHFSKKVKKLIKSYMREDERLGPNGDTPPLWHPSAWPVHEQQSVAEPVKPVDLPPAVLRQIMDYRPWFKGEELNLTKPISYITGKSGIYEVRRSKIGTMARKVEEMPDYLTDIAEGVTLSVPKIPWELIRQTVAFFRAVSKRNGSCEAFVQYWWDPSDDGTYIGRPQYRVFVPKQDVGGAHVHVKPEDNYPANHADMIHVADCHSHGSGMDAFFSGTDDGDEMAKGDRIYMVIGKVLDDSPQIKIRAVAGHGFLAVDPAEIIESPILKVKLHGEQGAKNKGSSLISYQADPFKDASFPSEWIDKLTEEKHVIVDPRLPAHYMDTVDGREAMLLHQVGFSSTKDSTPRLTRNSPFLPGTAFEDYETQDGATIRVYANGYCETLKEEKVHGYTD
jgi:hypothetical protein